MRAVRKTRFHCRRSQFRLPRLDSGLLAKHGFIAVVVAIFAVLLLLFSSVDLSHLHLPAGRVSADSTSGSSAVGLPYEPYVVNASFFPMPGYLNSSAALALPQLASTNELSGLPLYGLLAVASDSQGNENLTYQTATYNATAAQSLVRTGTCSPNCSGGLPLLWGAPVLVHSFGTNRVTGDALAITGQMVVAAATVSGTTHAYLSPLLGANGTWGSVANGTPFSGGSPRLVASPCTILLTTLTTSALVTSTIHLPCGMPYAPAPPNEPTQYVPPPPPPAPPAHPLNGPVRPGLPYVWGVVPVQAFPGSTVVIIGDNLSATSQVHFGTMGAQIQSATSNSVTVTVPGLIVPSTVDVTVQNSVGWSAISPSDLFVTPQVQATPFVTGVWLNYGWPGNPVVIVGSGFTYATSVNFGNAAAPSFTVISNTEISTIVPGGSGTVDVQVSASGGQSPTSYADLFAYGGYPPVPRVVSVTPDYGLPGTAVNITGSFLGGPTFTNVSFGTVAAASITFTSPSNVIAVAPLGTGMVDITVGNDLGTSLRSAVDLFTYGAPPPPPPTVSRLPPFISAQPFWLPGPPSWVGLPGEGILATNASNDQLVFYNSTNGGISFHSSNVVPFNVSLGSPIFTSLGATRLIARQGVPGQVTAVSVNDSIFGVVTTRENGRVVLESVNSANGGKTWAGPYFSEALGGEVAAPFLALSPAGYPFLAELDDAPGPWQVDQVTFSDSGEPLFAPQTVPSLPTSATAGGSDGSPSVAVDGLGRPLYAWSVANGTIGFTGAFPSPGHLAAILSAGLNATVPADYPSLTSTGVSAFRAQINATLANISRDLPSNLCGAETQAYRYLYPNLTTFLTPPITPGPLNYTTCPLRPASSHSPLAALVGAMDPDTFLGLYGEWMDAALGVGTFPAANWTGSPVGQPVPSVPGSSTAGTYRMGVVGVNSTDSGRDGEYVQVQPVTINPDAVWLNASGLIRGGFTGMPYKILYDGVVYPCGWVGLFDQAVKFYTNLSYIDSSGNPHSAQYIGTGLAQVFLTNLTAGKNGTWSENIRVIYRETRSQTVTCIPHYTGNSTTVVPISPGWPRTTSLLLQGTYTTGLSFFPYPPSGNPPPKGCNPCVDSWSWNNTVVAETNASLSPGYAHNPILEPYSIPAGVAFSGIPVSKTTQETVTITTTTHPGGYNVTWPNQASSGQVPASGYPVAPEVASWSCGFYQLPNPVGLYVPAGSNATSVTSSGATLTWYSNQSGLGWVHYSDAYGDPFSANAMKTTTGSPPKPGFVYQYRVELHGLHAWGFYNASLGVGVQGACFTYANSTTVTFQTLTVFPLGEYDLPYDSVSKQGGGAVVDWQVPALFQGTATFRNGTLSYWPVNLSSNVTQLPFSSLWRTGFAVDGSGTFFDTFGLNVTGLQLNWTYDAWLALNYTVHNGPFSAASNVTKFQYQIDTSGDGLTDWEKHRGWEVTYQNATGTWENRLVQALPNQKATNGLVNDFVEKQFNLDPGTVDTAGSHMLDTWNLTFDLGSNSTNPSVPAGANFRYWYELGHYDWTTACQMFVLPGQSCSWSVLDPGAEWSNLSDSAPWASEVLWSRAALKVFVNLTGVQNASWLRAVFGTSNGERTLTVWGKLSWGANPLASSTPRDGIPDGSRVDPLYDLDLKISSLSAWMVPNNSTLCQYIPSGGAFGWAVNFSLNWSTPSGPKEIGNFSSPTEDFGGVIRSNCGDVLSYQIEIPVNGTSQNQSLQLRLLLNTQQNSSLPPQLHALAFTSSGGSKASVEYDAFRGSPTSYSYSDGASGGGTLSFTLSTVASGERDPTFLWLPTDNGTLSNLPWGLRRYSGEQSFDLIVVNQTNFSALSSDLMPYAQNGSDRYQLTLAPGLNNLLIPRSQFLYSVLGQAILLGNNTSWTNSSAKPPLLNTDENGSTSSYGSTNPLVNLACYWQNRAIANSTGTVKPICNGTGGLGTEQGTPFGASHPEAISVAFATSASTTNTGGIPSEPGLENSREEGAALQSVLTMNLTSQAEIDLLIAALLDNTSGGVNGTFLTVGSEINLLGISSVVVNGLANATMSSSGLFGTPQGQLPPPPPPSSSLWDSVVNTFAGVAYLVVKAVEVPIGFLPFGIGRAIDGWIDDHLPQWMKKAGELLAQRLASGLRVFGALLAYALKLLLLAIKSLIAGVLSTALAPITNGFVGYARPVDSEMWQAQNDTRNNTAIPTSLIGQIGTALSGSVFEIALGIAVVLAIVLVIAMPVDFGPELLIPIIVGMLITIAFQAASSSGLLASVKSSFNQLTQGTFDALQNWVEHPDPPNPNWETASVVVLTLASFQFGFPLALYNFVKEGVQPGFSKGFLTAVLGFALLIVSLAFFVAAKSGSIQYTPLAIDIVGLAVGVLGVLRMFVAYRDEKDPALKTLEFIVLSLSSVDLGLALYVDIGSPGI